MAERRAPSAARLRRALSSGDTPLSTFTVRAASLAVVALLLPALARAVSARFDEALRAALATPERVSPTDLARNAAVLVAPALVVGAAAALVAGVAQTGVAVAPRPAQRGRLFDGLRAHDVTRALVAVAAILAVGWRAITRELPALATAMGRPGALLDVAAHLASSVVWPAVFVIAALAVADVVVRRVSWLRRLSPTPEEARRERRETEGDPLVRAARRREHERLAR